jgi:DNA-binding GntR family transcriptional regulator
MQPITAASITDVQEAVTQSIRRSILSGALAPGARLMQEELAAQLGVSRQPVREALRRLESEGFVARLPQRGTVVRQYSEDDIRENYTLRRLLESGAAEIAATRITPDELVGLRSINAAMARASKAKNQTETVEQNTRFHSQIHRVTRLPGLVRMMNQLWLGFTVFTPLFLPGRAESSVAEHARILDAISAGDQERARKEMSDHLQRAADDYFAWRLENAASATPA